MISIVCALLALTAPASAVTEPGLCREYLTFDIGGLIRLETYDLKDADLRKAVSAVERADWPSAERLFQKMVLAKPANLAARKGEAEAAVKLGHSQALRSKLRKVLDEAERKHRPDAAAYYELGILEIPEAINKDPAKRRGSKALHQAWCCRPDLWPIDIAYADMCLAISWPKGAREALRRAIKDHPGRHDFLPSYAYSLIIGSIGGASYDKTTRKWVEDPDPDKRRQPDEAMRTLQPLMKSAPQCPTVYFLLGSAYELKDDYSKAREQYSRYLENKDPGEKGHRRAEWIANLELRRQLSKGPPGKRGGP